MGQERPPRLRGDLHLEGIIHKYRPDLVIRLANGTYLLLEIRGEDTPKDQTKQRYMVEWVDAVNTDGRFGL